MFQYFNTHIGDLEYTVEKYLVHVSIKCEVWLSDPSHIGPNAYNIFF